MYELTDEGIAYIHSEFRKFPHYPTICELAVRYGVSNEKILEIVNQNERLGAFLYRQSVYTWRHVRQFDYLLSAGRPKDEIAEIMGIGSQMGWNLFMERRDIMKQMENKKSGKQEISQEVTIMENYKDISFVSEESEKIAELTAQGLSQRAIAKEIGKGKSYVQTIQVKLKKAGLIPIPKKEEKVVSETPRKNIENAGKDLSIDKAGKKNKKDVKEYPKEKVKQAVTNKAEGNVPEVRVELIKEEGKIILRITGEGVRFTVKE